MLIGVDTRIMKTVEVMKSFEVTRLAARGKYFVLQDQVDPCNDWIHAP